MQGVAPPGVHIHFTVLSVNSSSSSASASPPLGKNLPENAAAAALDSQESTSEEQKEFHEWLLMRWRRKDERMNQFYRNGDFVEGATKNNTLSTGASESKDDFKRFVEIPVELKSGYEFLDMILYGIPIMASYTLYRLFHWLKV
jgi:hypothetical protein